MDICLPVCGGGVFRKFLKISSTYIGKFSSRCGGVSLNIFKNPSTIIGNLPYPLAGCFKKFMVIYFMVTRKEDTPQRRANRKYEEKNREKRKAKCGNFQTMIPRELFDEINAFLKENGMTKVDFIRDGYEALRTKKKDN